MKITATEAGVLILLYVLCLGLGRSVMMPHEATVQQIAVNNDIPQRTQHPIIRLVSGQQSSRLNGVVVWGVALVAAVCVAPLAEELLWRGALQGALLHSHFSKLFCVLLPAAIFAAIHFRPAIPADAVPAWDVLWRNTVVGVAVHVVFIVLGIAFVAAAKRAASPSRFRRRCRVFFAAIPRDIACAAKLFVWLGPLVLALQAILVACVPNVVLDPIPLFLVAVAFGTLAIKTRRLTASVALHAMLNATSMFLLFVAHIAGIQTP